MSFSSSYRPQTNDQTERKIQELGRYLRAYCQEDQHSWSRFLPWAKYAQKSLRQNTTGLTPFQCILGYQPPLFPWTGEPSEVPAVDHWFRASEREIVGHSPHPPPTGSAETEGFCGCSMRSHSPISPWGPGVVVHPGHTTPPALQEAESPLHPHPLDWLYDSLFSPPVAGVW